MQEHSESSMTKKVLLGFVILFGLQFFPLTFILVIPVMVLTGPYVWGFLPHLLTLAFLYDIRRKRFSKKLLPIIILPYIGYYAFYFYEASIIHMTENKFIAENKKQKINFDPSKQVLVIPGGEELVTYNRLPVIYERNEYSPEGYLSYRLVSPEKCKEIDNIKRKVFDFDTFGITWYRSKRLFDSIFLKQCQLRTAEKPQKDALIISKKEDTESIYGINFLKTTYSISLNQQILGTLKTATITPVPTFPFLIISCGIFHSTSIWKCEGQFHSSSYALQNADQETVNKYGNHPVAIALKLERYKETDFSSFKDYEENVSFIDNWLNNKRNEKQDDLNEWGFRKDSLYLPKIQIKNGIDHYIGVIYARKEGGPFRDSIKRNIGKTVFIDATLHQNVNSSMNNFSIYAVCRALQPHCSP